MCHPTDATFPVRRDYASGTAYPQTVVAGDLDAGGDLDLATADHESDRVSVLRNVTP